MQDVSRPSHVTPGDASDAPSGALRWASHHSQGHGLLCWEAQEAQEVNFQVESTIGDDHWWPPRIWCQWSYLVISRVGIVFWTSFPPPTSCESVSPVVFSANTWASWASSFQECLQVIRGKNGKGECIRLPLYPTYLQTPAAAFCRTCPTDLLISVPTWSNTWNGSDGLLGLKELPPQGWCFFQKLVMVERKWQWTFAPWICLKGGYPPVSVDHFFHVQIMCSFFSHWYGNFGVDLTAPHRTTSWVWAAVLHCDGIGREYPRQKWRSFLTPGNILRSAQIRSNMIELLPRMEEKGFDKSFKTNISARGYKMVVTIHVLHALMTSHGHHGMTQLWWLWCQGHSGLSAPGESNEMVIPLENEPQTTSVAIETIPGARCHPVPSGAIRCPICQSFVCQSMSEGSSHQ